MVYHVSPYDCFATEVCIHVCGVNLAPSYIILVVGVCTLTQQALHVVHIPFPCGMV